MVLGSGCEGVHCSALSSLVAAITTTGIRVDSIRRRVTLRTSQRRTPRRPTLPTRITSAPTSRATSSITRGGLPVSVRHLQGTPWAAASASGPGPIPSRTPRAPEERPPSLTRGLWYRGRYLETVDCTSVKPSLSSSPWIRAAPQVGFARCISRIRSRSSASIDGRPGRRCRGPCEMVAPGRHTPGACLSRKVSGMLLALRHPSRPMPEPNPKSTKKAGQNDPAFGSGESPQSPPGWGRAEAWKAGRCRL